MQMWMRIFKHSIAAMTLSASTASFAQQEDPFGTGSNFIRSCQIDAWKRSCVSYTLGVFQGIREVETTKTICLPPGVNTGQLHEVGIKFIRDNPADSHYSPAGIMIYAWRQAFPCGASR
jgi:hypothetical protein